MYEPHSILLLYRGVAGEPVTLTTEDGIVLTTEGGITLTTEGFTGFEAAPEIASTSSIRDKLPTFNTNLSPWEMVIRVIVWGSIITYVLSCSGV